MYNIFLNSPLVEIFMKRKLGIDFDETLFETLEGVCKYKNQRDGENWHPSMFKSYKWHETWGGTHEEAVQVFFEFCESHFYFETRMVEDAFKYVLKLGKKYRHNVITYRSSFLRGQTIKLARNNFGNVFDEFYLPGTHNDESPYNNKLDVCLDQKIDTLIDDNIDFVEECIEHGMKIVLLDKSWNQDFDDSKYNNVVRAKGWKEVYEVLK